MLALDERALVGKWDEVREREGVVDTYMKVGMVVALSDVDLLQKVKMSSGAVEIAEYVEGSVDSGGQWCAENVD